MRTVLIGSDFMYDKDGNLKPIEINTSTSTSKNKLESPRGDMDFIFNPETLISFINDNNFTEVVYIGVEPEMSTFLSDVCTSINIDYEFVQTVGYSITVPYVEDSETKLIIRQSYDTTALVDDTYCRDKIEFMKLIQEQPYGSQFAYKDENGNLVSNITTIEDNGIHPNFILKSRYPDYDKSIYPKLYKVSNQEELDVIMENVNETYFLMPYYFNQSKVVNNKITKIRSLNILYPPTLESFALGQYTDTTLRYITDVTYNPNTFELDNEFNRIYVTSDKGFNMPKLIDTDLVQLADGTFKTALELQIGDELKTIIVPNADNVSYMTSRVNYEIDIDTFLSGAIYTTNTVKAKFRIENKAVMSTITFTDNSTWQDTANSLYLVVNNDDVKFLGINQLVAGDLVVLIDTTNTTTVQSITKEVQSVLTEDSDFYGWVISVDKTHIFLTKTAEGISDSLFNYATLEHNCYSPLDCPKFDPYCTGSPGKCATAPSDARLKKNIEYKYTSLEGVKIYTFEYNDDFVKNQKMEFNEDYSGKWEGVMAQDLIGTNFETAVISEGDYYKVDYNKLNTKLIKI